MSGEQGWSGERLLETVNHLDADGWAGVEQRARSLASVWGLWQPIITLQVLLGPAGSDYAFDAVLRASGEGQSAMATAERSGAGHVASYAVGQAAMAIKLAEKVAEFDPLLGPAAQAVLRPLLDMLEP